ncbi:recombinase family protein [Desulfuribacillus alkaliarsenatis]|uniref:Serine recombinase n=1 Tax=Desulfuribacillus alkaliarsenatis TaxID=766136 RepID=A0A1E5G516_9FIRM|nr:recombinase family protein [Desulfuribacillus alkaliarsenatis]OEF97776.1 hypothetical protein BHF68_13890 [Desulfuribacillus alkaliarsenatis]
MSLKDVLKPGMKGIFYGRHSTDKQQMDSQRQSVYELAKKYKCSIIEEYLDPGVSASKVELEKRESIQRMLKDARKKEFDFIAVYSNDRLARNPIEHMIIRLKIKTLEIPIVISSKETLYDHEDDLYQIVQDTFTKIELEKIITRTYDGLVAQAKKGHFNGGRAPYGYKYIAKPRGNEAFEPIEEKLIYVKKMFELYKKGEGFQAIANHLSEINSEEKWTKEKVRAIITNPFYAGYIAWGKRKSGTSSLKERDLWILADQEYITPIITKEEWELCWSIYHDRKTRKTSPKAIKTSFLLKDLVQCKTCKQLLDTKNQRTTSNTGKSYGERKYICSSCNNYITLERLHDDMVPRILADVRWQTKDEIYNAVEVTLNKEIQELENQIKSLHEAKAEYLVKKSKLEVELRQYMQKNENKKVINILTLYNQSLNKSIMEIDQLITINHKQIDMKSNFSFTKELIDNAIDSITAESVNHTNTDIRSLLLALVTSVTVNFKTKPVTYDYKLRIFADKLNVTNPDQISIFH